MGLVGDGEERVSDTASGQTRIQDVESGEGGHKRRAERYGERSRRCEAGAR